MKAIEHNQNLTPLVQMYYQIMDNYRNGLYGNDHLTMNEILKRANCPDLFNMMKLEEIDYLLNSCTGQARHFFTLLKRTREMGKNQESTSILPKGLKLTKRLQPHNSKGQLATN